MWKTIWELLSDSLAAYDYVVDNAAGRSALTGMTVWNTVFQRDTWISYIADSATTSVVASAAEIPSNSKVGVTSWEWVTALDAIVYNSSVWYVKSDGSNSSLVNFKWFADTTVDTDTTVDLVISWVLWGFSGLTPGDYYLTDGSIVYNTFAVWSQDTLPFWLEFNNNWTKFYVLWITNRTLYQYDLTTAYDLSTATYSSNSLAVNWQDTNMVSIRFKPGGLQFYLVWQDNDSIYEYNCTVAYDLSTATYWSVSFSFAAQETAPRWLAISSDWTKFYIVWQWGTDTIYQYTMTAYDISTASYASKSFVVTEDTVPVDMDFNSDWTKMYVLWDTNNTVYQYTLSTWWDVSSASYDSKSFVLTSQTWNPANLRLLDSWTKLFVVWYTADAVFGYDLWTANDISTASYASTNVWFWAISHTPWTNSVKVWEYFSDTELLIITWGQEPASATWWASEEFSAYLTADYSLTNSASDLTWWTEEFDTWSNFNATTWVYTAPSDWKYVFTFGANLFWATSWDSIRFRLNKNAGTIVRYFLVDFVDTSSYEMTKMLDLSATDTVKITAENFTAARWTVDWWVIDRTSFEWYKLL